MSQEGYGSYSYFNKPVLTNLQYLQAFEKYDVDIAYNEFRETIQVGIKRFFYSSLKQGFILLIIGLMLFPIPLYGYAIVIGYYIMRIVLRILSPYGISTGLNMASHELVRKACLHTFGGDKTAELLTRKHERKVGQSIEPTNSTIAGRISRLNHKLWGEKRWAVTLLVWIFCIVPLGFLAGFETNPVMSEVLGVFSFLYMIFPLGFLVYTIQVSDSIESVSENSPDNL